MNRAEQEASYPAPFVGGWYVFAHEEALPPGRVMSFDVDGEKLVAFRGKDGSVGVLERHCPHLGADLSDGKVGADGLECPFHRWCFAPDGQVTKVPYAKSPPRATLRARRFHSTNFHGLLAVYIDADKDRRHLPPPYELPREPRIDAGDAVLRGRTDIGEVRLHIAELAENSADTAHFTPLHGRMTIPFTNVAIPKVDIEHRVRWFRDPDNARFASFTDDATLFFLGRRMPATAARATVTFLGPGSIMRFNFAVPGLGQIWLYETHMPVGPMSLRVQFRWFADKALPRLLVAYVVGSWTSQVRADFRIWEKKIYRKKPMLVPEDGPILEMRRWFQQFYPGAAARSQAVEAVTAAG